MRPSELEAPAPEPAITSEGAEARGGRCAVLGQPNVGKSTLVNALVGQKLFAVTPKAGTTRYRAMGLVHIDAPPTQIALIDTPGIATRSQVLGRALREEARAALEGIDVALVMLDAAIASKHETLVDEDQELFDLLKDSDVPVVLALNKVDKVKPRERLLPLLARLPEQTGTADIVPISATRASGLDRLISALRPHLPEGLPYDPELLTDRPARFFAAEAVREAVLLQTYREVPHGVAVRIDNFEEGANRSRIEATVFVDKDSHKGIIIGQGGRRLSAIGQAARLALEAQLGQPIVLKLFIKVAEGWTREAGKVSAMRREETGDV